MENKSPDADDLAANCHQLFLRISFALSCGRLRLKPRERQLCGVLSFWSFGLGQSQGELDLDRIWGHLLPEWRRNEVRKVLEQWRRAGWLSVDGAFYRLAPDCLPGWADCFQEASSGERTPALPKLSSPEHLGNLLAALSQGRARAAKISQLDRCENFATEAAYNTFKRSNVLLKKRSTFKRLTLATDCENFATELKQRVKAFVGEKDWTSVKFWNSGEGWRQSLFTEDGEVLDRALRYVEAGLKSGEILVKKSRGAMLWDQFQRERSTNRQAGI